MSENTRIHSQTGKPGGKVPNFGTLAEALRVRAQEQPDRLAFRFLKDGQDQSTTLTYGELDAKARGIASVLRAQGAENRTVLINHLPGLDYVSSFFGCIYASAVAVPVYPPRFNPKVGRLSAIVEDAEPAAALTSDSVLTALRGAIEQNPVLSQVNWLSTDHLDPDNSYSPSEPKGEDIAFLQYTSGSTSSPKGVMLSHRNLVANLDCIGRAFEVHSESHGVVWLPPYHDMGLIGGILEPLFWGFPVTLMSPYAFLQRPHRWLKAIDKYRGTISGGPSFAFDLCLRRISDRHLEGLDLSSWELAFCGAEPIRPEVIGAFSKRFESVGFRKEAWYPCYGLAETSLMATGGKVGEPAIIRRVDPAGIRDKGRAIPTDGGRPYVGCGEAVHEHQVRIVDPKKLEVLGDGDVGEIWISGPSIAEGYWKKPTLSEQHFRARLEGEDATFLRTGDLGFVLEGELFITGRIKDVLIFRGCNYYPQDIEQTTERCHEALKPGAGAAFAVAEPDGERLVIVHELARGVRDVDLDEVVTKIREQVFEHHGIHPHSISLVSPKSIPFTSSGKVQRFACRDMFLGGQLKEVKRFSEV